MLRIHARFTCCSASDSASGSAHRLRVVRILSSLSHSIACSCYRSSALKSLLLCIHCRLRFANLIRLLHIYIIQYSTELTIHFVYRLLTITITSFRVQPSTLSAHKREHKLPFERFSFLFDSAKFLRLFFFTMKSSLCNTV